MQFFKLLEKDWMVVKTTLSNKIVAGSKCLKQLLKLFTWFKSVSRFNFHSSPNELNIKLQNITNLPVFYTIYTRKESVNYKYKQTFNSCIVFNGKGRLRRSGKLSWRFMSLNCKSPRSTYIESSKNTHINKYLTIFFLRYLITYHQKRIFENSIFLWNNS